MITDVVGAFDIAKRCPYTLIINILHNMVLW